MSLAEGRGVRLSGNAVAGGSAVRAHDVDRERRSPRRDAGNAGRRIGGPCTWQSPLGRRGSDLFGASGIICVVTQMTRQTVELRARFFRGLAEPGRLAILDALRDGSRSAGEVAAAAGMTPSNASRHLACLRDCGLVVARQEWRTVHYALADGVAAFLAEADRFIGTVAERVAACDHPVMGP
ncbi:MAG: hypothetical protein KatS3mg060_3156 [Dehalococcoidia bacterium]|jgi:DNA-binding transcriptional ArsR family regulator|nr:MAG: hypothetical protein KatS3mg060_3156 [Dehalococcoidia bacterium]